MDTPNENSVSFATKLLAPPKESEKPGPAGERLSKWLLQELKNSDLETDAPYPDKEKGTYPARVFSWVIPIKTNDQILNLHCAANPYKEYGWQLQFDCEDSFWKTLLFGENKNKTAARKTVKDVITELFSSKLKEDIYDIEWWDP